MQVYFIDVDGGQSTLFVTPAGKSLLIDTGWAGNNGLDAGRIAAAAKDAGVTKIDYLLFTHYHADHIGGLQELLARMPVGTFIDHGPDSPTDPSTKKAYPAYQQILAERPLRPHHAQARRRVAHSGNQSSGDQFQW